MKTPLKETPCGCIHGVALNLLCPDCQRMNDEIDERLRKEAMKTGPNQKPKPHPFYGDNYVRGKDPWHRDAFPDGLKDLAPNQKERGEGWFLQDAFGNDIGFTPDGTEL